MSRHGVAVLLSQWLRLPLVACKAASLSIAMATTLCSCRGCRVPLSDQSSYSYPRLIRLTIPLAVSRLIPAPCPRVPLLLVIPVRRIHRIQSLTRRLLRLLPLPDLAIPLRLSRLIRHCPAVTIRLHLRSQPPQLTPLPSHLPLDRGKWIVEKLAFLFSTAICSHISIRAR